MPVKLTIRVSGATPGAFVDVEMFKPAAAASSGGICPTIEPGPCDGILGTGDFADNTGTVIIYATWDPASLLFDGSATDVVGRYKIDARDRKSKSIAQVYLKVYNNATTPPVGQWK